MATSTALAGFTHTFGFTWTDKQTTLTAPISRTADSQKYLDDTQNGTAVVAGTPPVTTYNYAGVTYNVGTLINSLVSLVIVTSQAATVKFITYKANGSASVLTQTSGANFTPTLAAGVPLIWIGSNAATGTVPSQNYTTGVPALGSSGAAASQTYDFIGLLVTPVVTTGATFASMNVSVRLLIDSTATTATVPST